MKKITNDHPVPKNRPIDPKETEKLDHSKKWGTHEDEAKLRRPLKPGYFNE